MHNVRWIACSAARCRAPVGKTWSGGCRHTDIEQTEDAIVFKLDMPSTTKDDISIELHGRTLTISGERREQHEDRHEGYLSRERAYGTFNRSFMMPEDVSEDDITATFHDGELKVTVPRPKLETPRKIEIATS